MRLKVFVILLLSFCFINGKIILDNTSGHYLSFISDFSAEVKESRQFSYIEFEDLDYWSETLEPGAPCLPYRELRIAVPPEGDIKYSIKVQSSKVHSLNKQLMPSPQIIPEEYSSNFIYQVNSQRYEGFRNDVIEKQSVNDYNGYRLVYLRIYPVIFNSDENTLTLIKEATIDIEIIGNISFRGSADSNREWLDKYFIANYQQAKFWRKEPVKPQRVIPWDNSQFWYKVSLDGSGYYKLDSILEKLPDWGDYDDLRMFSTVKTSNGRSSEEIPLYIEGRNVCFRYGGSNKVLWLALGGNFESEPLRYIEENYRNPVRADVWVRAASVRDGRDIRCILIRPENYFEEAADELSLFHYEHFGIETAIAVQEQIFEEESGGEADPEAIKSFLQSYIFDHPDLEYVVLMGSGTSSFEVSSSKNKIIAWKRGTVPVTSDDYYVDFNNDDYPDIAIGRIPAQSESMMNQYLQRLSDYYNNMQSGWWKNQLLLVADDENRDGGLEGLGTSNMNHTEKMELTLQVLPGRMFNKIYGIEYPFDSFQNKPGVSENMISAINSGSLITYYIGHGSWKNLGDEHYFSNEMIPQLNNYEHLTHFIAGSCNVGNFDQLDNNAMAEQLLFEEDGGAICCLTATEESTPDANYKLLKSYLSRLSNAYESAGNALIFAKMNSGAPRGNSKKYNILGDPVMTFPLPVIMGDISIDSDSLLQRQTVEYSGDFRESGLSGEGETIVYDSEQIIHYTNFIPPDTLSVYEVDYYKTGNSIFKGQVFLESGEYSSTFIVPDNAGTGSYGKIITGVEDENGEYINVKENIVYADSTLDVENQDAPYIQVYLESRNFRNGDAVSENPLLIADIADSSGINLTINSGKNMLLLFDGSDNVEDLIDVTSGFIYNKDSYTRGVLTWQLPKLTEGQHFLQLIVYDNFGMANVAEVDFEVIKSGSLGITDLLPYPNPMDDEGYITFVLTGDAEVTVNIYTISGKKIKTMKAFGNVGYNQIYWDCRDADGDKIANNTYFYKVKAKDNISGKTAEKTGKLIILH